MDERKTVENAGALLVSESNHRVYASRAPRGDITGYQRDDSDEQHDGRESRGVGSANSEKQAGHESRQGERSGQTDADADERER